MVRLIAGFGGFLGRKHDGHPGPQGDLGAEKSHNGSVASYAWLEVVGHAHDDGLRCATQVVVLR
jgi:hypothetical protein